MSKIIHVNYRVEDHENCENYCFICMNEYDEDQIICILPCNKKYLIYFSAKKN